MTKEVSKTCRTCLKNNEELLSLYNGDDNKIVKMLEYILDTQLEVTDELPQKICQACFEAICRCYSFKTKCNHSFKVLQTLLDKRKTMHENAQIKVENEVSIYEHSFDGINEIQTPVEESNHQSGTTEQDYLYEEISIKSEFNEPETAIYNGAGKNKSVNQLKQNRVTIHLPKGNESAVLSETNGSVSNEQEFFSGQYGHFQDKINASDIQTVQYVIRELKEGQDSVDQLLEVNIRQCASCGVGFAINSEFNNHLKNCVQKNKTNSANGLQKSFKKHFCPYCEKVFPRPCRLRNHLRKHPEALGVNKLKESVKESPHKQHNCPHCDLSFNSVSRLKYHLRSHRKEIFLKNPSSAQTCNKPLIEEPINLKKYKCPYCDQEFDWASQLKKHRQEHKRGNAYVCKLCPKRFIHAEPFKEHSILVHNNEKPFKCKYCGNDFETRYRVLNHQRKHMSVLK